METTRENMPAIRQETGSLALKAHRMIARAGENLAAGQEELDEALQVWLNSASHCDNLMQAEFRDVGLACAVGPGAYQRYWVMHLGRSAVTFP
ncbi:CAP domain-containing protein, partial [Roseateles sp. GG27B]